MRGFGCGRLQLLQPAKVNGSVTECVRGHHSYDTTSGVRPGWARPEGVSESLGQLQKFLLDRSDNKCFQVSGIVGTNVHGRDGSKPGASPRLAA